MDGKVRLNTFQNDYVELIGVENLGKGDHTFQFSLQVKYDDQIINQVEFSTVFSITEEDLEKRKIKFEHCLFYKRIGSVFVLAHILVRTVEEFQGMEIEKVVSLIEGDPYISKVPVASD